MANNDSAGEARSAGAVLPTIEERLRDQEALLAQIARIIGLNTPRPDDPYKAARWDVPLIHHFSDLRDAIHALNNNAHILTGMLSKLSQQVEASSTVSRENREGIKKLESISKDIEEYARRISDSLGVGFVEKPLLMRDLFWLETNFAELLLAAMTAGQTVIFLVGDAKLYNSAMFRALSMICPYPHVWGIGLGFLSLGSIVAFACRKRKFRTMAAFGNTLYFGVTAFLPLFLSPGVLGWWQHLLLFAIAMWVLVRGPSQAI